MRFRRRLRSGARWLGVAAVAAIVVAYVTGIWCYTAWNHGPDWGFGVGGGCAWIFWAGRGDMGRVWLTHGFMVYQYAKPVAPQWLPSVFSTNAIGARLTEFVVPLWIPLLVVALPTALLCRPDR